MKEERYIAFGKGQINGKVPSVNDHGGHTTLELHPY